MHKKDGLIHCVFGIPLLYMVFFLVDNGKKIRYLAYHFLGEESGSLFPRYVTYIVNFHENIFKIHIKESSVLLPFFGTFHPNGCVF